MPLSFIAVLVFLFGIAFGSFLNVIIHRLPRGESVVRPASACPECGAVIKPYDNIPLASWLILRGRCRNCQAKISPRYFFVELLTGLCFVACFLYFGLNLEALKFCIYSFLLIGLIFLDAAVQLLPNALTLPGIFIGLFFSLFVPVEGYAWSMFHYFLKLRMPHSWLLPVIPFTNSLTGALVGALFIYLAGEVYLRVRGHEGMGFGDVKLMAMVGTFLGVKLTLFTIFAGSFVGSFYGLFLLVSVWLKRRRRYSRPGGNRRAWVSAQLVLSRFPVPFGVFLGSMALVAAFFGNRLLDWYWGLFLQAP